MTAPSPDMLEKAARAAYEKRRANTVLQPRAGRWATWEEISPASREREVAVFAAGLQAIREPDEGIIKAVSETYCTFGKVGHLRTSPLSTDHLAAMLRAMIDHILSAPVE